MKKALAIGALLLVIVLVAFASFKGKPKNNMQNNEQSLTLTSPVFEKNTRIPSKYTCDAENVVVPLNISGVPEKAKSLALIMDDPDIPQEVKDARGIEVFDHWVVFNIPTDTVEILEGQEPDGILGSNGAGRNGYLGPCPPDREHRYFFKLFALDKNLDLPEGSSKAELEKAMKGHIIEKTELIGLYERN